MIIYENLLNSKEYECILGKKELEALYINTPISKNLSEAFVDKAIEYINLRLINYEEKNSSEFDAWLSYLINYQNLLLDKVSTLIDDKTIDEEKLKNLIKDFIYRGKSKSEVSLGLVLCGDYLEDYEIDHIVKVFSKSGDYIFYLTDCIKNIEDYEEFLFDLCKKAEGTIKVFALMNMDFSKEEEVKYLINEGYKNNEYIDLIIKHIMESNFIWEYLKKDDLSFKDIKSISYIVSNYIRDKDVEDLPCIMNLINLYLPYAIIGGSDIYSIYAIYLMETVISHKKLEFLKDREFLLNIIKDKLKRCEYLFRTAVKKVQGDVTDIIELGEYYKYKFSFKELKPYLKTVKNGYFIYYYFQNSSSLLEKEDCKRYFIENPKFKEILEYFDDLENYNKASGEGDFIVKFDSALKRRNSIGS